LIFYLKVVSLSAASLVLTLSNIPTEKQVDEEFTVHFKLEINSQDQTYYLRPLFYESGKTQYSGCIKKDGSFVCDFGNCKNSLSITTNNSSPTVWEGDLTLEANNSEVNKLKIRRYTDSCLDYSDSDYNSNEVDIKIISNPQTETPIVADTLTPIIISQPTDSPPTPTVKSYQGIFIHEIMAYPESGEEWVEIYNDNNEEVDLNGFYIADKIGGNKKQITSSFIIPAKSRKVFNLTSSIFNDTSSDGVKLLDSNEKIIDESLLYEGAAQEGLSWSKQTAGGWCFADPSKELANNLCENLSNPTNTNTPTNTLTPTKTPTPTATPNKSPTPTSKLSPTPTGKFSQTPSSELSPTATETQIKEATESAEILGAEIEGKSKPEKGFLALAITLVTAGAGLISAPFILKKRKKTKEQL